MALSAADSAELKIIASRLGMPAEWLWMELNFESRLDPQIKNPMSSARGIMQWTNIRAKELGYRDSADLVAQNPTVRQQLAVVQKDLSRYMPFPSFQSLAMAVFRPTLRYADPDTVMPANVQAVNPGIRTVGDYVRKVIKNAGGGGGIELVAGVGAGTLLVVAALTIIVISKKKGG